jgi:hypothetical protein
MALNEWKDKNGNKLNLNSASQATSTATSKSTKTNKEKFTSLLYYMMKHKSITASNAEVVRLDDNGFTYKETYDVTSGDYTLLILVSYSRFNSSWRYELYLDTVKVREESGSGWEALLEELEKYFHTPKVGSREYQALTEWVDKNGKKVAINSKPSAASSSITSYKKRFEKLIKYHIDHASSELESITRKDIADDNFRLGEHYNDGVQEFDREIKVNYNSNGFSYFIYVNGKLVNNNTVHNYEDLVERLSGSYMYLPDEGTQEYDDLLTESLGVVISDTNLDESCPIADDFKLYEDLWEGTSTEELEVTLGKAHYNLYDDSDLEAYLNQSAKFMRRSPVNKKPLEYFKLRKVEAMLAKNGYGKYKYPEKLINKLISIKAALKKELTQNNITY